MLRGCAGIVDAGAYGPVPAGTLPAGDYTVTTTAAGVAPVAQTLAVREKIRTEYGCGIYSLIPFLGLAMEGHTIGD